MLIWAFRSDSDVGTLLQRWKCAFCVLAQRIVGYINKLLCVLWTMYVCMYACMYVCIYVCIYGCIYLYMCVHGCMRVCVCEYM